MVCWVVDTVSDTGTTDNVASEIQNRHHPLVKENDHQFINNWYTNLQWWTSLVIVPILLCTCIQAHWCVNATTCMIVWFIWYKL